MKKALLWLVACAVSTTLCASGGKPRQGEWVGKKGPRILLYNGGRPWQGDGIAKTLAGTGLRVRNFNSVYLDGFGGASIKAHMTDKKEPAAFDGFTPSFKMLSPLAHKLVMFHMIPSENYEKIFTPERIAQLKKYVEDGGNVLFTRQVPAGVLDDLLPVAVGDNSPVTDDEIYFADAPVGEIYKGIPDKIPVYQVFREAAPKDGAEVLSWIHDNFGNKVSVFLARKKIGKGTVTFFNVQKSMPRQIRSYENWAYNTLFFAKVVGDSAQCEITTDHLLQPLEAIPERVEIAEASASVAAPELGIADASGAPQLDGNTVVFANGIKLAADENGKVSITWAGKEKPLVNKAEIPQLTYSKKQKVFDSSTAEAVDIKEDVSAADIKWHFDGMEISGNEAVLKYTAPESEMKWLFKAGRLSLDGRTFEGIADRVELVKSPLLVSGVNFHAELDPENPLFAHRNDCYQPPRGYTAFDMTGKTDADTMAFAGQPFEMIVCENALYIGNRSYPASGASQLSRKKGAPTIHSRHGSGVGRIRAPFGTHYFWRWYADGTERGHNDYLAMYQFMRHMLRKQANLKELPPYPVAVYGYQLRPEEKELVITSAAKAGYRFIYPPNPESPIEGIASDNNMAIYETIAENGAKSHIWTAGSYVQGDGGWIINNHPEWFVRDENGKIFKYFSKYPVIDVNNPAFYDWYVTVLEKAIKGGVGWVYRDMDMAASGTVNYGLPESPNGLQSQIKFYKFFHDHDCRVSIEGMNPLVIDEYWFRAQLYTSFAGKEFAMVGQFPNGDLRGGLTLDPLRTGMYGCFPSVELAGTFCGLDRIPGEVERGRRVVSFVPKFNEALDLCGMPFIRETAFGTAWTGEKGGVLFFWNPAKKVTVDLPSGWKIRGVEGNVLTDVPGDSIIFIDKK